MVESVAVNAVGREFVRKNKIELGMKATVGFAGGMELWFSFCGKGKLRKISYIRMLDCAHYEVGKKDRLVWKE